MTARFTGSMTALITPFRDGRIDREAVAKLVEHQIANGTSALVPCGSTGESATLTHPEHVELVKLVIELVKGRLPVIAGAGSNSTSEAINLTRAVQQAGASAALLISPYYNKPTQEGIYQHYKQIAEATGGFPMIVYNIPGRTGSKIEAVTVARLAEVDGIVGLKDATGSLDEVQEVIRRCGDRIEIYSGDDSLTLPIVAVGGVGVISVTSNVIPRHSADAVAAALQGDWPTARRLHYAMLPLIRTLFAETNPIPVKAAMSMMGFCRDELRMPLLPMTEAPRAALWAELQRFGALG